jgi:hypothetical protein
VVLLPVLGVADSPAGGKYFTISVVDEATGRGVPLVELRTVHDIRLVTDSNGVVAFHEPGLMDQKVFFHVQSHGYEFPKDGFGYRGKTLQVSAGGSAELKIKRLNIAERLYRVTGAGIYRDSVLVGRPTPLQKPALNGLVLGSDSVVNAVYRGKLWWFWGDTNQAAYPLGNFNVPGATSALPDAGGLDPNLGVDLEYFVDDRGFARAMAPMPGKGPTWINGLVVLREQGRERMFASYVKVRGFLEVYERGLALFNDDRQQFERVMGFPLDAPLHPDGHPFHHAAGGVEHVYFAHPYPLVRVRADVDHLKDLDRYEGFTCLVEGTKLADGRVDRDGSGAVRWGWKKRTPPVGPAEQAKLIKTSQLKPEEALLHLQDADTGKPVVAHGGSVAWNRYRQRWVLIAVQSGGTSLLGEVWYAEADTPLGPWVYARKVVTHDRYSFYNPRHHPLFDSKDGRHIYFEGTYTHTFSGNPDRTPRYDYNQIMYRLDLADPRLALPVPIYVLSNPLRLGAREQLPADEQSRPVAFLALDRPRPGTIPIWERADGGLQVEAPPVKKGEQPTPLFHALPISTKDPPATTVPLYEFRHESKPRAYSTDPAWQAPGYQRSPEPICRVWRSPLRVLLPRDG